MHHIIVNPAAGNGFGLAYLPWIEQAFSRNGKEYHVLYTQAPHDASKMVKFACGIHSEGIIGIGGDGTIQEMANGIYQYQIFSGKRDTRLDIPIGIIPCGSGNDFYLSVNNGKPFDKKKAEKLVESYMQRALVRNTRIIDMIRVNQAVYLNIANIGIDARIVDNAAPLKRVFKGQAYTVSALKTIMSHRNIRVQININDKQKTGEYTLIAVCNGKYYGGGMQIAPSAEIDDGLITVCLIRAMSRIKALLLFPTLLMARHSRLPEVEFISCNYLKIIPEKPQLLCMDGNLTEYAGPLVFELLPNALELFV